MQTPTPCTTLRTPALLLATAALLAACGGGDPDTPCYVDAFRQADGSVVLAPHNCPPGTVAMPRVDCSLLPPGGCT